MWASDNTWRCRSFEVQLQSLAIEGVECGCAIQQEIETCRVEDRGLQNQTLTLCENDDIN